MLLNHFFKKKPGCVLPMFCHFYPHKNINIETNRQPNKRRKRKGSASNNTSVNNMSGSGATPGGKQKRSPGPQAFNPVPGVSMQHGVVHYCFKS